jgi:hypothetical protein
MDEKTFSLVAGVIFTVVALFHLVRIFAEWTLIIGDCVCRSSEFELISSFFSLSRRISEVRF